MQRSFWFVLQLMVVGLACKTGFARTGQWNTFGPANGPVYVLAIDPQDTSILYASNSGALFKSTDRGANWRVLNSGLSPGQVQAIAVDPHDSRNLYAASGYDVFKSTDGGMNWTLLKLSDNWFDQGYWTLTLDPKKPGVLYAGGADLDNGSGALFKSTDGGSTWRKAPINETGWASTYVFSVTIDPQNTDVLYLATSASLYQSLDGGSTWKAFANNVRKDFMGSQYDSQGFSYLLAIDPQNPSTIYLGTRGGVFKSTDRGGSWAPVLPARSVHILRIDPHDPAKLYAAVSDSEGGRSFRSTDGGASWTAMSGSLPDVIPTVWDPRNPDIIYRTGTDGLFKSTDRGNSWRHLYSGLATHVVKAVVVDPQSTGFLYAFTSDRVFTSRDGARRWDLVGARPIDRSNEFTGAVAINPESPRIMYAGSRSGVYKSTDGGARWTLMNNGFPPATPFSNINRLIIDPQNPDTVYALAAFEAPGHGLVTGLFRSTDGGVSWFQTVSLSLPLNETFLRALAMHPQNPQKLYVGTSINSRTNTGPLYRSSDGGSTWSNISFPAIGRGITSVIAFAFDPQNADIIYAAANCDLVFRSSDGGTNWIRSPESVPRCVRDLLVDPQNPDTVFAGTDSGLFKSANGGSSWVFESGVPSSSITGLAVDRMGRIYAATSGGGVFATFESPNVTPEPSLTLGSTEFCTGQSWHLAVSGARANSTVRLMGISNGEAWDVNEWGKTDAIGVHAATGAFARETEGRHTVYIDVDGATSNDVSFLVSPCRP
jgi:photosystem II stability/assembly factor-like uncharacterized protein